MRKLLPITPISPNHSGRVPSQRCTPTPSIRASQTPDVIDLTVDDDVPAPVPVVVDGPAADANSGVETIHSPASSIEVPLISRRSSGNMAELQRPASRDQPVAMDSPSVQHRGAAHETINFRYGGCSTTGHIANEIPEEKAPR